MSLGREYWAQISVCVLCCLPVVFFFWSAFGTGLGPDPGREVALFTGLWTLRFLLLTLTVRPLQRWLPHVRLLPFRRTLGLFTLGYASLHMLCWLGLLLNFRIADLPFEIMQSPYVLVGMSAWILLLPLGMTSTRRAMRSLGRRWKLLHRLIYLIAILGILHFFWLSKDPLRPFVYSSLLAILFAFRVFPLMKTMRLPGRRTSARQKNLSGHDARDT